jgi:hypothetical protein
MSDESEELERRVRELAEREELERRVLELVERGELPSVVPDRLWGGAASGRDRCALCGQVIPYSAMQFEIDSAGTRVMHAQCLNAWSATVRLRPKSG